jgi:phenylalanyl-tRNA synthetase beta chain
MRVPLSWLRDYVDVQLTPELLAERLTLLGMEVQGIERWGADWENVVIGELLTVERHPRADRLSLTTVTIGSGAPLEIVCGATNIEPGQRIPVALPGAVLPGGRRIERTEKMGVASNGMLCSGDELRLTSDADGILILPADAPLGSALVDVYGDTVLDIDVKPNRGDALSMIGLAREVAAATGAEVRFPETDPPETGDPVGGRLGVEVQEPDLCSRFVGRFVSGVSVGPSPERIQMRLMAAGQRVVSNVVDVSNYVMLELGKPIHTFDAAAVREGRIIVRRARADERVETLDHVKRTLNPETLVIADEAGVLGLAGVMGGAASEVTDGTTDVIIESAIFDPVSIRRTAFHYALRSEASLRFEKGQEHRLARLGADRAARLMVEWAGGSVAVGAIDSDPSEPAPAVVAFRPRRIDRWLGTSIAGDEQRALLAKVGIATDPAPPGARVTVAREPQALDVDPHDDQVLLATVPSWRRDLEVEADIAEEVARVHGYDRIPVILPDTEMPAYRHPPVRVRDKVREVLIGAGLTEVVTHSLVAPEQVDRFSAGEGSLVPGEGAVEGRPVTVVNPLSSQHSVLRRSLIGSLVDVVADNRRHGRDPVAIFEIGKGYGATDDGQAHEWWRVGFAIVGRVEPPRWDASERDYDLDDAKGMVELVARMLHFPTPDWSPLTDDPDLHPGRAASVRAGDRLTGRVGELHPGRGDVDDADGERVIVAQLAVAGVSGGVPVVPTVSTLPRHPSVLRDLAVVVDEAIPAAETASSIVRHGGALLVDTQLFDIYRGRPLSATEKSLAYRLTFQEPERTLTEDEVDRALTAIRDGLATDVGGRIRT